MAGDPIAIELRYHSCLATSQGLGTLGPLSDLGLDHVVVDAAHANSGTAPVVPAVILPSLANAQLRGRGTRTWCKKVETTGERFDYLSSAEEVSEWPPQMTELACHPAEVHLVLSDNRRNHAAVNGEMLQRLLDQIDRPSETDQGLQLPLRADRARLPLSVPAPRSLLIIGAMAPGTGAKTCSINNVTRVGWRHLYPTLPVSDPCSSQRLVGNRTAVPNGQGLTLTAGGS